MLLLRMCWLQCYVANELGALHPEKGGWQVASLCFAFPKNNDLTLTILVGIQCRAMNDFNLACLCKKYWDR